MFESCSPQNLALSLWLNLMLKKQDFEIIINSNHSSITINPQGISLWENDKWRKRINELAVKSLKSSKVALHSTKDIFCCYLNFQNFDMIPIKFQYDPNSLPSRFDAREKWGDQIHPVLDQGWCAASWAFSTISVASDRWNFLLTLFGFVKLKIKLNIRFQFTSLTK